MARPGRPSRITDKITRADGTVVPLTQVIIDDIALMGYVDKAAAHSGVDRTTVTEWLRVGARANSELTKAHEARVENPEHPLPELTLHQRRCLAFSLAVDGAEAAALSDGMGLALRCAKGETLEVITEKQDKDGNVLERTVRRTPAQVDSRMLIWFLEHRWPDLLGPRARIELTGADGGPVELSAESPGERLDRILTQMLEREADLTALVTSAEQAPLEAQAIEAGS